MKKLVVILLLLAYGFSTLGATLHLHYCMDKLAGWSLWHSDTNTCSKCGMKVQKNSCCKDEHQPIKLTTAHQRESTVAFAKIITTPTFPAAVIALPYTQLFVPERTLFPDIPSPIPIERLYLHYRVLLI